MFVNKYKQEFNSKKVQKIGNLNNVYIFGARFVVSRTDTQNWLDITFKALSGNMCKVHLQVFS